jgi:hypothetical protein
MTNKATHSHAQMTNKAALSISFPRLFPSFPRRRESKKIENKKQNEIKYIDVYFFILFRIFIF